MPGPKFDEKRAKRMHVMATRKKDPMTYAAIGKEFGVSPQRVTQIITRLTTGSYTKKEVA